MDKETKIKNLKGELDSLKSKINAEFEKIKDIKSNLKTTYRRKDRAKYEEEGKEILKNLEQYSIEQANAENKLAELEAGEKV